MTSAPVTTRRPSLISRFFRNPDTGDMILVEMPNIPLWIFLACAAARLVFQPVGTVGTAVSIIGTVSLAVWAVMEVLRGDSPFRRVLGGLVLATLAIGLLTQ